MNLIDVTVIITNDDDDDTEEFEITLLGDRLSATTVRYLVLTGKKYERLPLYKFEDTVETFTTECISGFYDDATTPEDLGYIQIKPGYYIHPTNDDTDDDMLYNPSDEDEES